MAKKQHHEEHADESWLLPYSDLLTLLLALFIVMFAMSSVDQAKFEQVRENFNIIFSQGGGGIFDNGGAGGIGGSDGQGGVATITLEELVEAAAKSSSELEDEKMMEIKENIEGEISTSGYGDNIKVVLNTEGLEIAIQEVVLFNSGEAEILQSVYPLLKEIGSSLKNLNNSIKIAGHTDNIPIHTAKYRSNWDLSAMRAINVMHFLVDNAGLAPNRFSIQGYGEYAPKYDNSTLEGRAQNRRVEIFVARIFPLEKEESNLLKINQE